MKYLLLPLLAAACTATESPDVDESPDPTADSPPHSPNVDTDLGPDYPPNPFDEYDFPTVPAECHVYVGCERTMTVGETITVDMYLFGWPASGHYQPTGSSWAYRVSNPIAFSQPTPSPGRSKHTVDLTAQWHGEATGGFFYKRWDIFEPYFSWFRGRLNCINHELPENGGAICGLDEEALYPPWYARIASSLSAPFWTENLTNITIHEAPESAAHTPSVPLPSPSVEAPPSPQPPSTHPWQQAYKANTPDHIANALLPTSPKPPFFCINKFKGRYNHHDQTPQHTETVAFLPMPGSNLDGYHIGYAVDLPAEADYAQPQNYTMVDLQSLHQEAGEFDMVIPVPWAEGPHQIQVALWRDEDPTMYTCVHMMDAAVPVPWGIRSTHSWANYGVIGENAVPYTMTHGEDQDVLPDPDNPSGRKPPVGGGGTPGDTASP